MTSTNRQRAEPGTILHKPARQCPISQPHSPEACGVMAARRQNQQDAVPEAPRLDHDPP